MMESPLQNNIIQLTSYLRKCLHSNRTGIEQGSTESSFIYLKHVFIVLRSSDTKQKVAQATSHNVSHFKSMFEVYMLWVVKYDLQSVKMAERATNRSGKCCSASRVFNLWFHLVQYTFNISCDLSRCNGAALTVSPRHQNRLACHSMASLQWTYYDHVLFFISQNVHIYILIWHLWIFWGNIKSKLILATFLFRALLLYGITRCRAVIYWHIIHTRDEDTSVGKAFTLTALQVDVWLIVSYSW